ncbi:intermembrane transport protein PqiB [Aliikangiella coralliicola]|uniref:Intermembrane transport protein PqiB n=1 Tax=Aliikangiella coralliicola TaxID=2592383 RepID=A0A545UE99_9GAMM|nr:intermembrane transport protein PqiB [Aliikangiella coralliicola]TQV87788.1 intermembrane transport protein PqiB [Aliikangiella coralliicola]
MLDEEEIPQAEIKPVKHVSKIWFIPIAALLIGVWMVYYTWSNQGPAIMITFETAEGLEINSTKVKLRDITIGEVIDLKLTDDFKGIEVTARLDKNTEELLKEDTSFWVAKPRIGAAGISGLNTILSGAYIELSPGTSDESRTEFVGLESPPVTPIGTPGIHITLDSDDEFAFEVGDPIIYKGLTVGRFEDVYFNFEERIVYYNAFIRAPYHELVTENTRFWNVSGVRIDLKADGITLQTGNVETLLTNGVTFGVPEGMPHGKSITERDFFTIYGSYEEANLQRFRRSVEYVVLVSDSIRGLNVGAPVEYRGVNIGRVAATNIHEADHTVLLQEDIKIPVLISMQPGRVGLPDTDDGLRGMVAQTQYWIKNGLKASLKTGNLLTGSLYVDLQHYDDSPIDEIERFMDFPIIPTVEDEFSQIAKSASVLVDNLSKLPLDELSGNANQLIAELTSTVKEFKNASKGLTQLLENTNQQDIPKQIQQALEQITLTTKDFSADSAGYEELTRSLRVLQATMHELKPVLQQLKNKPNSLIFSSEQDETIEPKKSQSETPEPSN